MRLGAARGVSEEGAGGAGGVIGARLCGYAIAASSTAARKGGGFPRLGVAGGLAEARV